MTERFNSITFVAVLMIVLLVGGSIGAVVSSGRSAGTYDIERGQIR